MKPSQSQLSTYQHLFDYYNWSLFKGKLPEVYLDFTKSKAAHGYFIPNKWGNVNDRYLERDPLHEISLNPDGLVRDPKVYISTLVHEMVHLWQQEKGSPGRGGYHNKEWAGMMNYLGLKPISFDNPGKEIGNNVSHEIIPGGKYDLAYGKMPSEYIFPYCSKSAFILDNSDNTAISVEDVPEDEIQVIGNIEVNITQIENKKNHKMGAKFSYACPCCKNKVWGKYDLNIMCGDCKEIFVLIG